MNANTPALPDQVNVYTDGASRGNPGPASWAYVVVVDGAIAHSDTAYLGEATNNQAEYHAVINALQDAEDAGVNRVDLVSDSKLLVNQLNNEWQVKDGRLQELYDDVQALLDDINATFTHAPRENRYVDRADTLCNQTLDEEGY